MKSMLRLPLGLFRIDTLHESSFSFSSPAASQDFGPPQLQLEFKCFLVDQKSGKHVPVSQRVALYTSP
jgi:hypothetical protein